LFRFDRPTAASGLMITAPLSS